MKLSVQDDNLPGSGRAPFFDSLTKGFSLHDFFRDMRFSNNGGGGRIYYYRPKTEGFFYSYFGSDHFGGDIYGKVELTTYVHGRTVGRYNEQDEELISIFSHMQDTALRGLDLIGKPVTLCRSQPAVVYNTKEFVVLQENEHLLKLFVTDGTISSFEYARVKNPFKKMTKDERIALLY